MSRPDDPHVEILTDSTGLREFYRDAPFGVRANMIFSADGAAAFAGRAGPLSCPADQRLLVELRGYADVVLVGAGTARAEGYGPARLSEQQRAERAAEGRSPLPRIAVVSRTGRLPESLFTDPRQRPILITSAHAARRYGLRPDSRHEVVLAGDESVDLRAAVETLTDAGMGRILCEGGPTLLNDMVTAGLLKELCVTTAPKLAGTQPVGAATISTLLTPGALSLRHVLVHEQFLFSRYALAG
ncbi:pyrimidine reductase family protein [Mycolicibacterium confluentis]|uniref:Bacterial bifunctional deaminase-reductase C-terminal domain-containing protein n=1 Tax=Mycolicibacterium confluentis TaxID=28047 RepID=A0A7I7Y5L4_9MYCO|nr:pyrimidine reductase family protein [Mycolicibacterium confluentis]BBZ36191.1 hypothetical protein MCNF_47960 [Mycolicibacterium confluentis]